MQRAKTNLMDKLKILSDQLVSLMEHPEPGVASWCIMVQSVSYQIADTLPLSMLERLIEDRQKEVEKCGFEMTLSKPEYIDCGDDSYWESKVK